VNDCVLQCVAGCCSVLRCVAVRCSALQCVAVCCSVLQCVAVCGSVLQYVAVCCSVLQCVGVCCSVQQCTIDNESPKHISTLHLLPWKTIIVSMKKLTKMQRAMCCSRVPSGVATFHGLHALLGFFAE